MKIVTIGDLVHAITANPYQDFTIRIFSKDYPYGDLIDVRTYEINRELEVEYWQIFIDENNNDRCYISIKLEEERNYDCYYFDSWFIKE